MVREATGKIVLTNVIEESLEVEPETRRDKETRKDTLGEY